MKKKKTNLKDEVFKSEDDRLEAQLEDWREYKERQKDKQEWYTGGY